MPTNPFLGARPYGPADDRMFFGRATATAALVERVDLQRLTIVCSPSGLGKTSLLRAAVMPWLERDGLSPVYMRPDPPAPGAKGSDSEAATSLLNNRLPESLLCALYPPPDLEMATLACACGGAPDGLTLEQAPKWFSSLAAADPIRLQILEPLPGPVEILSVLSRYLRGTITLAALANWGGCLRAPRLCELLRPDIPLTHLHRDFPFSELAAQINSVCSSMRAPWDSPGDPVPTAPSEFQLTRTFLETLCGSSTQHEPLIARPDGDRNLSARIVLILDQFEQVFTLSTAASTRRALKLLADLINQSTPINIVLAIRKEWYADLVQHLSQHLQHPEGLSAETFYLEPMKRHQAMDVMRKAPASVGAPALSEEQKESIWQFLQRDDTIDPVAISIACHEHFGSNATADTVINDKSLESLFDAYLTRALSAFADERDRNEARDLLGQIAGSAATREFATQEHLVNAPLANTKVRARILKGLQDGFLIKGEDLGKSRSKVYDIMHERLLAPVRAMLARHPEVSEFRTAADRLKQPGAAEQGIGWHNCLLLLLARRHVVWDALSAGVVLLSFLNADARSRAKSFNTLSPRSRSAARDANSSTAALGDRLRRRISRLAEACFRPADPEKWPIATRSGLSWWMSEREILDRLAAPPERDADEFALKSLVQGPPGWMRQELRQLLGRLREG
jgi:hypothetical protein